MNSSSIRRIAIAGVLTAMTVLTTIFTKIPISVANGYFNLGDTVIIATGALFGGFAGAFAGAAGSAIADILTGAYLFAPISFIVKGAEGFVAGILSAEGRRSAQDADERRRSPTSHKLTPALVVGGIVMVAGYFLAEATVLSLFDRTFGVAAAVAELPFNLVQGGVSVILARLAIEGIRQTKII